MTPRPEALDLFVVTAPGLEEITAGELARLGVKPLATEPGGIQVRGDTTTLWVLNLHLRSASRVLVRLADFRAVGFQELEKRARKIPWLDYLPPGVDPASVDFEVTCRKSRLYHSGAVAARLRDALVEACEGVARARSPDAGPGLPAPRFVARLVHNRLSLSADASGENLHRRGYREAVGKAPLRETLAAAMLLASGWQGECPLMDPFCGSGTIPIEAALLAAGIPPGARRRFAFEAWWGTDREEAAALRNVSLTASAASAEAEDLAPIVGSDRDGGALDAAAANAARAGVGARVAFHQAPLSRAPFPAPPGIVVTNPPYGHRVGDEATLRNLYARLGDALRDAWPGGRLVLLSADRALTGQMGLETRILFRTRNGGIPVEAVEARIP